MPDVKELGRRFKAKHPGAYDDLSDEDVGRKVKAKWPGAYDDFTDTPAAQPPQKPDHIENLKIGAERGYRKHIEPSLRSLAEASAATWRGDFGPLLEMGESAIRGTVEALRRPQQATPIRDPKTGTFMEMRAQPPRDTRITELQNRRQARQQATPEYQQSQRRLAELDKRAADDHARQPQPGSAGRAASPNVQA